MESRIAPADPVRGTAIAGDQALFGHCRIDRDQHGQVGQKTPAADPVQVQHVRIADAQAAALICSARFDETVAQDPTPCLKAGADQSLDMSSVKPRSPNASPAR